MKRESRIPPRRRGGFTLVEVLLVLVILVVIAGLGITNYVRNYKKGLVNAAKAQVKELSLVVDQYYTDCRQYPPTLQALVQNPGDLPGWNGPYLRTAGLPLDPWQHEYQYSMQSSHGQDCPDIYSLGPEGQAGAEIGNWQN